MLEETWVTVAKILVKHIRDLPVVRDHPNFWFRLHLDGLSAHEKLYVANKIFFDAKILLVIENSHSSHINQAYDKDPARASKQALRDFLPDIRDHLGIAVGTNLTQWLLLSIISTLEPHIRKEDWVRGFRRVNLHPKFMIPVEAWISTIADDIVAATALKPDHPAASDLKVVRTHAPKFYRRLSDDRKRELLEIINAAGFEYRGETLVHLHERFPEIKHERLTTIGKICKFNNALLRLKEEEMIAPDAVMPDYDPTLPVRRA
jgi:hypothetical protein